jgi:purine-binding chemotaxis protein CheW
MEMIREATHIARSEFVRTAGTPTQSGAQYLSFRLGGQEYGVDILRVREIRSYETPTRIANLPLHVKGVVNLRGVIVPIIDLRLKLGCDTADYDALTVVIVLNLGGRVIGAVADAVSDVLELPAEAIQRAPQVGNGSNLSYILGIASLAERTLILVDIDALMSEPESCSSAAV